MTVSRANKETADLIRCVFVSVPWKFLPQYLETMLHLAANIEIRFEGEELDQISRSDLRAVAERLHANCCRIMLHGPFWDLCPGSIDPLIRQASRFRLQQFFDLLPIFQPAQVVCHTGYQPLHHGGRRPLWLEQSLAVWEPLVERAEHLSIPLLLENVWEHDPELHLEIFERIPSSYFGFCLDVGHQHSFSKTPLSEWLEALAAYLGEVHLHDNDGTRDAHLPIGRGTIDFDVLFRFLRKRGIAPMLTLEPHRKEHIAESLAALKRVIHGMSEHNGAPCESEG
jgi:sugar phosphate isomerase/epimerase